MPIIREVTESDLGALVELARKTTFGLTTLTPDEAALQRRIEASVAGLAPLLVMLSDDASVHEPAKEIWGTSGLFSRVGNTKAAEPFYAYRLEKTVHQSSSLSVHLEIDVLHLVKLYDGPTELSTLFVHPDRRGGGNGRSLSLSRFLYIADRPERFDSQIIAELRGIVDQQGKSPFWDAIGRHFFQVEFPVADALSVRDKKVIAELMPTHPIYVPLLPQSAQAVIGRVHPATQPAMDLLESEGFHAAGFVDIFDGGPCVRCDRAAVRTIRESWTAPLIGAVDAIDGNRDDTLLATVGDRFLATACRSLRTPDGVTLTHADASKLELSKGDTVRVSPILLTRPQGTGQADQRECRI